MNSNPFLEPWSHIIMYIFSCYFQTFIYIYIFQKSIKFAEQIGVDNFLNFLRIFLDRNKHFIHEEKGSASRIL